MRAVKDIRQSPDNIGGKVDNPTCALIALRTRLQVNVISAEIKTSPGDTCGENYGIINETI